MDRKSKILLTVGGILAFFVALPLFIYAVLSPNGTFEIRNKAQEPSPSPSASPTSTPTPTPTTCTLGIQSISLSPDNQQAYRSTKLSYTITVTNNDTAPCEPSTFNLSAILPYSGFTTSFSTTNLKLNPQASATATVDVTSGSNSPLGDIPVGVMAAGPKAAVVAASTYKVLAPTPTPTPATPKPTATPEVVYLTSTSSASSSSTPESSESPTPSPEGYTAPSPKTIPDKINEILAGIPGNYMFAGIGIIIFLVVIWILGKMFGKKNDNPPKMTPPTEPQAPSISHGIEPPLQNPS